jgi:hypothetical protein
MAWQWLHGGFFLVTEAATANRNFLDPPHRCAADIFRKRYNGD